MTDRRRWGIVTGGEVQPAVPADATTSNASPVRVDCLGDQCTGCSDSQCWTVRADGGDV